MIPDRTPAPGDLAGIVTARTPPTQWRAGLGGVARAVARLAAQLGDLQLNMVTSATATLTASTSTTATITLRGQSISGVPMLASYTPTNGDTVILWQTRGQLLIIGRAK